MGHKRGKDKRARDKAEVLTQYKADFSYLVDHVFDVPVGQWFTEGDSATINKSLHLAIRRNPLRFYFRTTW